MAKETDIRHRFITDPRIANTIIDALEERIAALEAAIATSPLPDVTADDNGDVLTVVEGAWDKATPSGGGGNVAIIEGTLDQSTGVATASYSEIGNAISAGKLPVLKIGPAPYTNFYVYQSRYSDDGQWLYLFTGFLVQNNSTTLYQMSVDPSGTITPTQKTIG